MVAEHSPTDLSEEAPKATSHIAMTSVTGWTCPSCGAYVSPQALHYCYGSAQRPVPQPEALIAAAIDRNTEALLQILDHLRERGER